MKVHIKNETINLPGGKTYEERLDIINKVLEKYDEYLNETWDLPKTKVILSKFSDYLSRSKGFKEGNKHAILGKTRKEKLYGGDSRMIPFSSLPTSLSVELGIKDYTKEDSYE